MHQNVTNNLIKYALDDSHLSHLRTVKVCEKEHVDDLYTLIRNYSYKPFSKALLKKLVKKSESEICLELLYGTLGEGSEGFYELEPKACIIAARSKNVNLTVLRFAHDPWFDAKVATVWANYRIEQYMKRRKSIKKMCWFVDEKNLELQTTLRELHYTAKSIDEQNDLVFIKE